MEHKYQNRIKRFPIPELRNLALSRSKQINSFNKGKKYEILI